MPELLAPKDFAQVDFEQKPFKFGASPLGTDEALSLVTQTFNRFSTERQHNAENRWMDNDRLYVGWVPKRTWPGSKIPRSHIGIPVAFDQIESMLPIINAALFDSGEPSFFQAIPTPFSTVDEARQKEAAMMYQLETPMDHTGITSRHHIEIAVKEVLQHGTGGIEFGINPISRNFFVEWAPMKDLFFDPDLALPIIDRSSAVIRRKKVTIEEIKALAGVPEFDIPSEPVLNWISKNAPSVDDPIGVNLTALRGQSQSVVDFLGPNPARNKIELLQFWTDKRMIWVLGQRAVILNRENPYGCVPFAIAPCYLFLNQGLGMSVPDVVEGDQLFIQGLVNARADELALGILPPRSKVATSLGGAFKSQWHPGLVEPVRDAAKDQEIHFPQGITQQAFAEVSAAEERVFRRTGMNSILQGSPQASNANRTLGGQQGQAAAGNSRLSEVVSNIEKYMIVPMLYKMAYILDRVTPEAMPQIPARSGNNIGFVPRQVLGKPVLFIMNSARKMVTRDRLINIMQPMLQTLLSEPVMALAGQSGQTLDFTTMNRFIGEATDTADRFQFFRPMTPEEQQMAQQPSPDQQLKAQLEQAGLQARMQMAQMKSQTDLQKAQIESETKGNTTAEQSAIEILKILASQDASDKQNSVKILTEVLSAGSRAKSQQSK